MSGRIFINPDSGGGEIDAAALRERFPDHEVEECPPGELRERIVSVLAHGPEFVGVAGGDGTIRSAAEALRGSGTPLLVIPAGTRNHFARDLGIGDLDAAVRAATEGVVQTIDLGCVNERWFVNNSSVGAYPEIVQVREHHEGRFSKRVASVIAIVRVFRRGRALTVTIDDVPARAWLVFVGNGAYGDDLSDLGTRASLTTNVLDVTALLAAGRFSRCRIVLDVVRGRISTSRCIDRFTARSITIDVSRPLVAVALDGEVEELETPLQYSSEQEALTVLVPSPSSSDG